MNAYEQWYGRGAQGRCETCGHTGIVFNKQCYICPRVPYSPHNSLIPMMNVMLESQIKIPRPRKPKTPKGPQGYLVTPRRKT
jgi:hypothetical protein